jgi:hypothetical protein
MSRSQCTGLLLLTALSAALTAAEPPVFHIDPIPPAAETKIRHTTWHKGCPVGPEDLRQLTVTYLDYQRRPKQGQLYVHKDVATELERLFRGLYDHHFLIERISPVENYSGNDDASMAANNTSAFNCRDTTGKPGTFSNHSWGRAIDINPLTNPYVKDEKVLPPGGRAYLDRTKEFRGSILKGGFAVKEFEAAGWTWGGRWTDRQDYQHFEKPKRVP